MALSLSSRRFAFLAATTLLATACIPHKDSGDAGADASVDAAVAVVDAAAPDPLASVANLSSLARFGDESRTSNTVSLSFATKAHSSPPNGPVVASLSKGTTVTEVSTHDVYALIVFADPKTSASEAGWVVADSLNAGASPSTPGAKVTHCPAGQTLLYSDTDFCGHTCKADSDCPSGQACKGSAHLVTNGKEGAAVESCVAGNGPAPTPTTVDAGTTPTPTPPASLPAYEATPAAGNKCSGGFVFFSGDNLCHKPCPSGKATDCAPGNHVPPYCENKGGSPICTTTR